jgi:hypothetical protein
MIVQIQVVSKETASIIAECDCNQKYTKSGQGAAARLANIVHGSNYRITKIQDGSKEPSSIIAGPQR